MTDDYFYIEEISQNQSEIESERSIEKKCLKAKDCGDNIQLSEQKSQELRLHEIEQQLEMAESRCNTLKGQVDYMKMLYNGMNKDNSKPNKTMQKFQQQTGKRQLMTDTSIGKRKRMDGEHTSEHKVNNSKDPKFMTAHHHEETPSRDVDNNHYPHQHFNNTVSSMSTVPHRDKDHDRDASAAVKSINNIISGITNSVNRLTQLQVQIGPSSTGTNLRNPAHPVGIQTIKCSPRISDMNSAPEKPYHVHLLIPKRPNYDETKSAESVKSKGCKKKRKLKSKIASKHSLTSSFDSKKRIKVTARHTEKKTRLVNHSGADINQLICNRARRKPFGRLRTISSRTVLTKKAVAQRNNNKLIPQEWKSDKLIELYHNSAAKIVTASEDSIPKQKSPQRTKIDVRTETRRSVPPPSSIFERQTDYDKQPNYNKQEHIDLTRINNQQPSHHPYRTPLSPINEQEVHYENYYKNNYELPTIASKMKQVAKSYFENFNFRSIPFVAAKSITPSHNLGVNIQQVLSIIKGRKPITGISPTLAYNIELAANKLGSRPLSALVSNLGSRLYNPNRNVCPLARKYPFSHFQEMAKQIPEETVEEIAADFEDDEKLLQDRALGAGDKDPIDTNKKSWYIDTKNSEKCTCIPKQGVSFNDVYNKFVSDEKDENVQKCGPTKRVRNKPWNDIRKVRTMTEAQNCSKSIQINRREKSLKEVLKNLHDEFATLTNRYDELKTEISNEKSDNNSLEAELEKMEKDLQNKEDEITTVMSLYKEVLQLKQQVKVLRKRASQSTLHVSPLINRNREYRDLNAAGHLTKLLRHIQQFQETLRNKSNL